MLRVECGFTVVKDVDSVVFFPSEFTATARSWYWFPTCSGHCGIQRDCSALRWPRTGLPSAVVTETSRNLPCFTSMLSGFPGRHPVVWLAGFSMILAGGCSNSPVCGVPWHDV